MLRITIEATDTNSVTDYVIGPEKRDVEIDGARLESQRLRDDLQRSILQTEDLKAANVRLKGLMDEAAEKMQEMMKARGLKVGELGKIIERFFRARQAVFGEEKALELAEVICKKMEAAGQRKEGH